jgi:mRNA interferase MazF
VSAVGPLHQGDVWWANLADPERAEPGFRRPAVVVQGDAFNRSRLATAVCVPLTSNLKWRQAPGKVFLPRRRTGLDRDSVANVSQIVTLDRSALEEAVGSITGEDLFLVLQGIDIVLGRA